MDRKRIKDLLNLESSGSDVLIKGWVRTKREAKEFCFLEVNDGSTITNIQVIADKSLPSFNDVQSLSVGCSISVSGRL
ncbi:MAG: OB-fold nucleic acid binding domain-containing protein, partial [Spirochaetota bacterium]|nr:OB-fold nucleic acid binding domain-containing protein [Spirochaetota bacterium]